MIEYTGHYSTNTSTTHSTERVFTASNNIRRTICRVSYSILGLGGEGDLNKIVYTVGMLPQKKFYKIML